MQLPWAQKAWNYSLKESSEESATNRWESTSSLLLEELTALFQKKLGQDLLTANMILSNWRDGQEKHSKLPTCLRQHLPEIRHLQAERQIFLFLYYYPGGHFFESLSTKIPAHILNAELNPEWAKRRENLILSWYE